ncbi:hypothetical protein [Aliarcobacter cryaerophilus]|uniref:hypothetical protein n=1 Tax=Aliarcobacter cryaerophilus TaxID=28198 RepID=UPI003DA34759
MKKVTIIGLGGAGINFLNYLKKKELDNLDLKLLPLEDENIDKNLIVKAFSKFKNIVDVAIYNINFIILIPILWITSIFV